jgi:hypothetical protein
VQHSIEHTQRRRKQNNQPNEILGECTCQENIEPFYKVFFITRWTSIKCNHCGSYANREINGQFLFIGFTFGIVISVTLLALENFIPGWSWRILISFVFWLPIMTYIDAKTIRLVQKEK